MLKIKNQYYGKKENKSIKNNSKYALDLYEKRAKKNELLFFKFRLLLDILEKYISTNQLVIMIKLLFLLLFHLFYLLLTYHFN